MASLVQPSKFQFFDINGNPLVGGKLYFYVPNTTTPKNTWRDAAQGILNTNPVVLDARGEATIFLNGLYDIQLTDALDNVIYTLSDIGFGGSQTWDGTITITGDIIVGGNISGNFNPTSLDGSIIDNGTVTNDKLAAQPWTDIASASTTQLDGVVSNNVRVTGTTTINSFGSAANGTRKQLRFEGSLVLSYNPVTMILPGGTSITTGAGDCAVAISLGGSAWVIVDYQFASSSSGLGIPAGALMPYAGQTEPSGWLFCYGQNVSRSTYASLFSVIGTLYGVGDGSTTFGLPDLRGRLPAGRDDMGGVAAGRLTATTVSPDGNTLGATGGAQTHTLTSNELAVHGHAFRLSLSGDDNLFTTGGIALNTINQNNYPAYTGALSATPGQQIGAGGGGAAHNNIQPTLVTNWVIKT